MSDLHRLTTKFTMGSTSSLKTAVLTLVAEAIASGMDPSETTFYLQSQMPWQSRIYAVLQSSAAIEWFTSLVRFDEMSKHDSPVRPPDSYRLAANTCTLLLSGGYSRDAISLELVS